MRKNHLIIILIACCGCLVFTGLFLSLFFKSNVESLLIKFPVYDSIKKEYKLVDKKPGHWVKLGHISKYAKWAIVVSEDWAFYEHNGIDFFQLKLVLQESLEEQELSRGASTITQQVVKNTLLSPERSLWRKFREFILAYKLEKVLTKDQILEIYLNIVELGDGIYGIKEGAYHYFNKHPSKLTAREGAFLAMLLPSPVKYSQSFKRRELTEFAHKQVKRILLKLRQAHIFSEEDRLNALEERFWWEPQDTANFVPAGSPYADSMEKEESSFSFEF